MARNHAHHGTAQNGTHASAGAMEVAHNNVVEMGLYDLADIAMLRKSHVKMSEAVCSTRLGCPDSAIRGCIVEHEGVLQATPQCQIVATDTWHVRAIQNQILLCLAAASVGTACTARRTVLMLPSCG
jgi:hypothetical protein